MRPCCAVVYRNLASQSVDLVRPARLENHTGRVVLDVLGRSGSAARLSLRDLPAVHADLDRLCPELPLFQIPSISQPDVCCLQRRRKIHPQAVERRISMMCPRRIPADLPCILAYHISTIYCTVPHTSIVPIILAPSASVFSVTRPVGHAPQLVALRVGGVGNSIQSCV